MLSSHDTARQAWWSKENLPATCQRVAQPSAGIAGTDQWVNVGAPFACRLSTYDTQGATISIALQQQHRMLYHVVCAREEMVTESDRLVITVDMESGAQTITLEVLQIKYRTAQSETRILCRGPV
jgi:hypothetical protein